MPEATTGRPSCGLTVAVTVTVTVGLPQCGLRGSVTGPPGTVAPAVTLSRAVAVTPTLSEVSAGCAMPAALC